MKLSQEQPSLVRELHLVRKNISEIDKNIITSETIEAEAELQLQEAKKTAKNLASQIEDSNTKKKQRDKESTATNKARQGRDKKALVAGEMENHQNDEVIRKLESAKQELSQLKLNAARVLKEKSQAEQKLEAFISRNQAHLQSSEELTQQIEEINEELVLVELARIEAVKELSTVEAQRKEESQKFYSLIEEKRKKISSLMDDIGRVKALKEMLEVTNSEIEVFVSELNFIREIEKMSNAGTRIVNHEKDNSVEELNAVKGELEALKKDLAFKKEEGFKSMVAMDTIRKELERTTGEVTRLKKREMKEEKIIEKLNSRLVRARDKLEAANASEATVKSILSTMFATWDKLKTEADEANKEREITVAETARIRTEVEETDFLTNLGEETVQAAIQELEEVQSSESKALAKLKVLTENTIRTRALASKRSSTITISKFEYDYLRGCAAGAREVADRKVEAAQACVEALKMSEKEIMMETEMARSELRELSLKEVQELHRANKSLTVKDLVESKLQNKSETRVYSPEESGEESSPIKDYCDFPSSRVSKHQKSTTQGRHTSRGSSLMLRRRRRAMLNLARCFAGKQITGGPVLQERS